MSTEQELIRELKSAPEPLLNEVLNFVCFLKGKTLPGEARATALVSEDILARDWLSAEEDEAWKDL